MFTVAPQYLKYCQAQSRYPKCIAEINDYFETVRAMIKSWEKDIESKLLNLDNTIRVKELIETISDKLLEIDCSNPKQLQSFSYNELQIKEDMDIYTKVSIMVS